MCYFVLVYYNIVIIYLSLPGFVDVKIQNAKRVEFMLRSGVVEKEKLLLPDLQQSDGTIRDEITKHVEFVLSGF